MIIRCCTDCLRWLTTRHSCLVPPVNQPGGDADRTTVRRAFPAPSGDPARRPHGMRRVRRRRGLRRHRRRPDHWRTTGPRLRTASVIVPGLVPIDFGWARQRALQMKRTRTARAEAGLRDRDLRADELNPAPHPFPDPNGPSGDRRDRMVGLAHDYLTRFSGAPAPDDGNRLRAGLGDMPRKTKFYPGVERLPLPECSAADKGNRAGRAVSEDRVRRRVHPADSADCSPTPTACPPGALPCRAIPTSVHCLLRHRQLDPGTASGGGLPGQHSTGSTGAAAPVLPGVLLLLDGASRDAATADRDVTARVRGPSRGNTSGQPVPRTWCQVLAELVQYESFSYHR